MKLAASAMFLAVTAALFVACSDHESCEDATQAAQDMIDDVCEEKAYTTNPLCTVCVTKYGAYSIDDDCRCRPLTYDADFCYYDASEAAKTDVRAALDHASALCRGRNPVGPDEADPTTTTAASSSTGGDEATSTGSGDATSSSSSTSSGTGGGGAGG